MFNGYVYLLTLPPQTSSFLSLHLAHLRARTCAICFSRARTHTLSFSQTLSIACSLVYSRAFTWSLSLSLSLLCTHCLSCTCNTLSAQTILQQTKTLRHALQHTTKHTATHTASHTATHSLSFANTVARSLSISLSLSPPLPNAGCPALKQCQHKS